MSRACYGGRWSSRNYSSSMMTQGDVKGRRTYMKTRLVKANQRWNSYDLCFHFQRGQKFGVLSSNQQQRYRSVTCSERWLNTVLIAVKVKDSLFFLKQMPPQGMMNMHEHCIMNMHKGLSPFSCTRKPDWLSGREVILNVSSWYRSEGYNPSVMLVGSLAWDERAQLYRILC